MKLELFIFLLCIYCCICLHPLSQSKMCPSGNDCSFQIPFTHGNACSIYGTKVCKKYNFSSWNLEPLVRPPSQFDAPFSVSLFPFAANAFNLTAISAINITLTVSKEGITGFSVILKEDNVPKFICRLFEFRNSTFRTPMTFFYDCFQYLSEEQVENATMIFTTYPVNVELSYFVYIPPFIKKMKSVCDWQPLVMIYQGSLKNNVIQMKFSPSLEHTDIQFYFITLFDASSDKKVESTEIPWNNTKDMLSSEFFSAKNGYYFILINVTTLENLSCSVYKTDIFIAGNPADGETPVLYLVILGVLGTIAAVCAAILVYHCCHSDIFSAVQSPSDLKLLIIYSPDCDELNDFILSFIDYLKCNYSITVHSSHGLEVHSSHRLDCKPTVWLAQKYSESDIIIFVTSEGLFHVLQQNDIPPLYVKHHWKEQVPVAMSYVDRMVHCQKPSIAKSFSHFSYKGKKKFCIVCFPFSGKHHIPDCLKCMGPLFVLPHNEGKFYRYLFGHTSVFSRFKNNRVFHQNLKMKSDENVKDHLKIMMETVSANLHIHYIENSDEDNNEEDSIDEDKHLNSKGVLKYNSSEKNSFISSKEDGNFYLKDESKYQCDKLPAKDLASLKKSASLHTHDESKSGNSSEKDGNVMFFNCLTSVVYSGTEHCEENPPQFSRQEFDSDNDNLENKDYMEYFVRKDFSRK